MKRAPSIRDLERRNDPQIAILPTAARRKVEQQWNDATRAQARRLRMDQPWPGEYERPEARETRAQTIDATRTPELLIAMAVVKVLTPEQRQRAYEIASNVYWATQDDAALDAVTILNKLREGV
jgi:hypothetical protein